MQTFTIKRCIDALKIQTVEIKAESASVATLIARQNEQSLVWRDDEILTFDARRFVAQGEDGLEVENSALGDF